MNWKDTAQFVAEMTGLAVLVYPSSGETGNCCSVDDGRIYLKKWLTPVLGARGPPSVAAVRDYLTTAAGLIGLRRQLRSFCLDRTRLERTVSDTLGRKISPQCFP